MARYIDADLIKNIELIPYKRKSGNINVIIANMAIAGAKQVVDKIPTADVQPVIHAHWETDKHAALDFCSSCGEAVERYVTAEQMDRSNYKRETFWNYCPHCGACMDEE